MRSTSKPPTRRRLAFSLAELIAVMAVIALLITLSAFGVRGTLVAQQLSSTTTRLANDLAWCAMLATKENRPVWVHFVKRQGENLGTEQFRAWEIIVPDRLTGAPQVVAEIAACEPSVIIHDDERFSTLLQREPDETSGVFGQFAFLPAGGTNLPPPASSSDPRWCVTLVIESQALRDPSTLPVNRRTLVINSITGAVREY